MNAPDCCNRLTLMFSAADTARADIALTPQRIYYRFATDDSIEDGELPAPGMNFGKMSADILDAATQKDGETPLCPGVSVKIFADNRITGIHPSEPSLRRLVEYLCGLADEFNFLKGFC